jgi:hypothetical protein
MLVLLLAQILGYKHALPRIMLMFSVASMFS